ncbi:MAG: hypothetical protein ACLT1X_02785 [Christensenellales bacterium]
MESSFFMEIPPFLFGDFSTTSPSISIISQRQRFAALFAESTKKTAQIKRMRTKDRNGQRLWRKFAGKPFLYRRIHGMIMKGKRRAVRMARSAQTLLEEAK